MPPEWVVGSFRNDWSDEWPRITEAVGMLSGCEVYFLDKDEKIEDTGIDRLVVI